MVYRCECVDQWPCPESPNEKRGKGFRFVAESSTRPGLQHCPGEARCPWSCDGPTASGYESRPGRKRRSEVPCEKHPRRNAEPSTLHQCSSLDHRRNG